jgi:Uri superfamily endonuclease
MILLVKFVKTDTHTVKAKSKVFQCRRGCYVYLQLDFKASNLYVMVELHTPN